MFFNWRRWLGGSAARRCGRRRPNSASHRPRLERLEDRLTPSAPKFVSPLAGTPYQDWAIVNYVDRDPGAGTQDFRGNRGSDAYTIEGHDGLDVLLPNFAKQDAG